MEDYPWTLMDLETRFATEEACREYLARMRWPAGCACAACGHQVSVTAGTIFQDTRTPLPLWFRAIWWVTSQKNGASALGIHWVLGLGSYRTAWTWLHTLRRAMVRPGRDCLTEKVEVEETLVGGVEPGGGRRHIGKKALVVVAAEVRGRAIGRIRMNRVADSSADSLLAFVQKTVAPGTVVITDGLQSYRTLPGLGCRIDRRLMLGSGDSAQAVMPRVLSLLKRWIMGTHQGAVSREHLDYYLDEFTFRFNRRTSRHRGRLFYRPLEQAVAVKPVPYMAMVRCIRGLRRRRQHNR
jgi:hypothetical protein